MDKENIYKAIEEQLEDIREQFEIIRGYEGKIPAIELDLIMSNIREVYETFIQLEKMNQPVLSFTIDERKSEARVSPPVKHEEPEPEAFPPVQKQPAEHPSDRQPEDVPVRTVRRVVETPPESTYPEPKAVKTTLDLFGESSSTLADRLKDSSEKKVADKLLGNKINDLRSAIGINEKFLYINELFDGNLRNYEEAIVRLNNAEAPGQAEAILEDLEMAFKWDRQNPAVKSFLELVSRKF